jgi:hypothetical protein
VRRPLVVLGLALAIAGGAIAAPPAAPISWADWVGDWQGKLEWKSCTADGARTATLPLEATDGAVAIDLANAGDALGALSLVEDGAGWMGQNGDVRVHISRKADKLELAVDLESGCQVRGELRRESSGIAACDRLATWARIEARCTKLVKPPLENEARLARQRASWAKADRSKLSAQCEARASKVETELVDVGCAPSPDPAIGMNGAECRALAQAATRLGRCAAVPSDLATLIAQEAQALVGAAQQASKAELPYVEVQCKRVRERITQTVQQSGCPVM